MTHPKKQIIWIIIATIVFYAIGRLAYEYFYRWTLQLVKYFSKETLSFFGKYPFWFFGDPIFGLIFCSIPLTIFLCFIVLKNKFKIAFNWTLTFYAFLFVISYLTNCYYESFYLVASNDFYKEGQTLTYGIRDVSVNEIFLTTIILTTVLTLITNFIKRLTLTKNASLQQVHL